MFMFCNYFWFYREEERNEKEGEKEKTNKPIMKKRTPKKV